MKKNQNVFCISNQMEVRKMKFSQRKCSMFFPIHSISSNNYRMDQNKLCFFWFQKKSTTKKWSQIEPK